MVENIDVGVTCPICGQVGKYTNKSKYQEVGVITRIKDCVCGNRFVTEERSIGSLPVKRRGKYNHETKKIEEVKKN